MCQPDIVGKIFLDFLMQAKQVTDVREVGGLAFQFVGKCHGLAERKMGWMRFVTQCVDHQHFGSGNFFLFLFIDKIGIRDVGEIPYPVTEHRQVHVFDEDGNNSDSLNGEGFVLDCMKIYFRDAGIFLLGEHIFELGVERLLDEFRCIHFHFFLHNKIKGAKVIQPCYMVAVFVRVDDGIQPVHFLADHLLAEIRAGIDHKPLAVHLDQD